MHAGNIAHLVAGLVGKHQLVLARQHLARCSLLLQQLNAKQRVGNATALAQHAQLSHLRVDKFL